MGKMFEIEKDVPLPTIKHGKKYPWEQMDVGDSFFVPEVKQSLMGTNAAHNTRMTGRRYTTRKENGGVRVWRVE